MRRFALAAFVGICGYLAGGCNDDFSKPWKIDKTRVLGAKAQVDADPDRASPAPGEPFHVEWFVVSPGGSVPTNWAFSACRQADVVRGAQCDGPALTQVSGMGRIPSVGLTTPSSQDLGTTTALLLTGTIEEINVQNSITLQVGAQGPNRNPHISSGDPLLDGAPWTAEDGTCDTLPKFPADDGVHNVGLAVRDGDRESIPEGGRETMQLSQFTTAGKLDRLYSVIDGAAPPGDVPLTEAWTAERGIAPPAGGLVVHFYFGLRDSRGGMDFAQRALCVKPAG